MRSLNAKGFLAEYGPVLFRPGARPPLTPVPSGTPATPPTSHDIHAARIKADYLPWATAVDRMFEVAWERHRDRTLPAEVFDVAVGQLEQLPFGEGDPVHPDHVDAHLRGR